MGGVFRGVRFVKPGGGRDVFTAMIDCLLGDDTELGSGCFTVDTACGAAESRLWLAGTGEREHRDA
jgi:hypothetical protein